MAKIGIPAVIDLILAGTIFLHACPSLERLVVVCGLQRLGVLPRDLASDQAGNGQRHRVHPLDASAACPVSRPLGAWLSFAGLCFPSSPPLSEDIEVAARLPSGRIGDPKIDVGFMPARAVGADLDQAWEGAFGDVAAKATAPSPKCCSDSAARKGIGKSARARTRPAASSPTASG